MDSQTLFRKIIDIQTRKVLPPSSFWPATIVLPSNITQNIIKLSKWTREDGFEYETSVFEVDNHILSTPLFRGTKTNVKTSHKVQVIYKQKDKKLAHKQLVIDDKLFNSSLISLSRIPRKPSVNFIFSLHSHPIYINAQNQETYSFFSDTDINSLINSKSLMLGLACDTLWLVCKTDKTIKTIGENGKKMLYRISHAAFQGERYLNEIIKKEMDKWGLVFYNGKIGGKLRRII